MIISLVLATFLIVCTLQTSFATDSIDMDTDGGIMAASEDDTITLAPETNNQIKEDTELIKGLQEKLRVIDEERLRIFNQEDEIDNEILNELPESNDETNSESVHQDNEERLKVLQQKFVDAEAEKTRLFRGLTNNEVKKLELEAKSSADDSVSNDVVQGNEKQDVPSSDKNNLDSGVNNNSVANAAMKETGIPIIAILFVLLSLIGLTIRER